MTALFSKPKMPTMPDLSAVTRPRRQRMPTEGDAELLEASRRTRRAVGARRGRLSTIMTDGNRESVGSSGQSLGA